MKARPTVFVVAIVASLVVGISPSSEANVITKSDGNDTKGPLDLAGVKVSHKGDSSVFTITTIAAFSNAEVALKNGTVQGLFEVALDTNADRRFNFYVDVFYASGHFRGVIYKRSGDVISYHLKAARVAKRSVKVSVPHGLVSNKGSYDFAIFSAYFADPCTKKNPCVDVIPNRYPLIRHDFTPPTVNWVSVPGWSTSVSDTLEVPVSFTVHDNRFGSGLKSWTLERHVFGIPGWVSTKSGSSLSPSFNFGGEQGATYDLRIVAIDRQKNKSVSSVRRTSFPFDDRNLMFQYDVPTLNDSVSGAFLGTTTSVPNGQSVVFSVALDGFACILGGPTTGAMATGEISVNGSLVNTFAEDGTTDPRRSVCVGVASGDSVEVDTTSVEPLVFDGALVVPPDA